MSPFDRLRVTCQGDPRVVVSLSNHDRLPFDKLRVTCRGEPREEEPLEGELMVDEDIEIADLIRSGLFKKTLLRPQEVADLLDVSRQTIYRWIEAEKLKATKIGDGTSGT